MHKSDDAEDPLLEETLIRSNQSNALMKRRYRRGKAMADQVCYPDQNHTTLVHPPELVSDANKVNLKLAFLILLAYIIAGGVCFYLLRYDIKGSKTDGIVDAIYLCIVTMTTVGYGDLVPDSTSTKVLACVLVFVGMGIVGLLLSKAADNIVENQEILLVKAMHMRERCSAGEMLKEVESHRSKYKFLTILVLLLVLVFIGTIFLYEREGMDLFDAFYCVCATVTSLGYGDKSFLTREGRIFAAFWILMSTICLAHFFYSLAELYTERRRKSMVKWVLSRKFTVSDLEAADLDHDKVVSASEFVVYKLKEMGKISEVDVAMVMEMFKVLDVDHSGTISTEDLEACNPN